MSEQDIIDGLITRVNQEAAESCPACGRVDCIVFREGGGATKLKDMKSALITKRGYSHWHSGYG